MNSRQIRTLILVSLLVGVSIGAVWILWRNETVNASLLMTNSSAPGVQFGASNDSVKVIGTFVAPNQAALAFKIAGRIKEIKVGEGALVKKGDVLATLETMELDLSVAPAQAVLRGAQARLAQTKLGGTEADIGAANAALDAARQIYVRVAAGPAPDEIAPAKANLDRAQAVLDQAQAAYDRAGGASNPNVGLLPSTLALQQATSNYQAALAAYNLAKNHPTASELAAAAAQVKQAEDALARLRPTEENLVIAQAAVDQAQAALDLAKQQAANASLTAPSDGTVIWVGPHVGESVSPAAAFAIIADLSRLQLQVGVDESVLHLIQVGQKVVITPEAFKNHTIAGKVARVGFLATTTGGIINLPVTIDMDATNLPLRPGLSASAEIQIK